MMITRDVPLARRAVEPKLTEGAVLVVDRVELEREQAMNFRTIQILYVKVHGGNL
jgi:hypothetical protein